MSVARHGCGDCQACGGTEDQPCSWGELYDGHTYPECPDIRPSVPSQRCGRPWRGCHHCGATTPCPEPCWYDPKDADGNPVLFAIGCPA